MSDDKSSSPIIRGIIKKAAGMLGSSDHVISAELGLSQLDYGKTSLGDGSARRFQAAKSLSLIHI